MKIESIGNGKLKLYYEIDCCITLNREEAASLWKQLDEWGRKEFRVWVRNDKFDLTKNRSVLIGAFDSEEAWDIAKRDGHDPFLVEPACSSNY
jgi:hypothetical protein